MATASITSVVTTRPVPSAAPPAWVSGGAGAGAASAMAAAGAAVVLLIKPVASPAQVASLTVRLFRHTWGASHITALCHTSTVQRHVLRGRTCIIHFYLPAELLVREALVVQTVWRGPVQESEPF